MKSLVILAGGKSTRMGKDKLFLRLDDGETFLTHLCRSASEVFDRVVISAGSAGHCDEIRKLLAGSESFSELELIPDRYENCGPMGGIVSVYEETGLSRFAVVPVDVPYADMQLLSFFYEHCGTEACVLKDEDKGLEPLLGAYGEETLQRMKSLLAEDNFRIRAAFLEEVQCYTVKELQELFPDKDENTLKPAFRNINTEQEYRDLIQ